MGPGSNALWLWQTDRELMAVAAGEEQGFRPGMVAMSQTFGDQLNIHPHVHALVTRGGWTASGEWVGVPYVSSSAAEQLFRHKIIRLLQRAGLLDDDRTRLLLSWHHSGFSVHNFVTVPAGDGRALEALARYCLPAHVAKAGDHLRRLVPGNVDDLADVQVEGEAVRRPDLDRGEVLVELVRLGLARGPVQDDVRRRDALHLVGEGVDRVLPGVRRLDPHADREPHRPRGFPENRSSYPSVIGTALQ